MQISDIIIIGLLLVILFLLIKKFKEMATSLDDLSADVSQQSTLEDSLITLTNGLKTELDGIIAGDLSPAKQAQVDTLFASLEASKAKLAAAITANTPVATGGDAGTATT